MAWSQNQQIALAIVPKVSSLFSLFGSLWIMLEVVTDNSSSPKRKHPYHRLLLGMSVYDILESVWNFASTWAIPEGTEGVWDARGTRATCTAQGFFLTLSVAVPIYNAFLSLYYVQVICYGIPDAKIAQRTEPFMHLIAFSWAFFTAIYSASTGLFNNANLWCWIAPLPGDCRDSVEGCERGENSWIYRWVFYFAPLWFCIFFATVCTFMVYMKVQKYDRISLKYRRPVSSSFTLGQNGSTESFHPRTSGKESTQLENIDEQNDEQFQEKSGFGIRHAIQRWQKRRQDFREDNPRTAEVFRQSLWYLGAFYLTHVWSTTNRTIQLINNGQTYYGLIVLHSFFDPLQGFLNYLVYQRPRFLRIRAADPDMGALKATWKALNLSRFGGAELSRRSLSRSSMRRSSRRQSARNGRDNQDSGELRTVQDEFNRQTAATQSTVEKEDALHCIREDSGELSSSQLNTSDPSLNSKDGDGLAACDIALGNARISSAPGEAELEDMKDLALLETKLNGKDFAG